MLDMVNKKHKYQYAQIKGGRAVTVKPEVLEELEELGKRGYSEVGIYATGKAPETEQEPLYRESRNLLKTNAKLVGRGGKGDNKVLKITEISDTKAIRINYSQRVGALMSYMFEKWQNSELDKEGYFVIRNLSKVARDLNTTPQRLKEDITRAGGFAYPYIKTVKRGKDGDTIDEEYKKLFEIKVRSKVEAGTVKRDGFINPEDIEGLNKNRTIEAIFSKPCKELRESIGRDSKGREIKGSKVYEMLGIGNVLTPVANILLGLELSLWGYKLYCYMGSNRPDYSIGLNKLLTHLGVTDEDLRKQGKPRYKSNIDKGLEELKLQGYVEKWTYSEGKDMYYWKYTSKAFRHPDMYKGKTGYNTNTENKGGKTPKNH